jgi:hypothetical protein
MALPKVLEDILGICVRMDLFSGRAGVQFDRSLQAFRLAFVAIVCGTSVDAVLLTITNL